MRLRCNMRVQFGEVIHEVGEVIEKDYEEVKNAIRDRALTPLPDLPPDPAQNAHDAAVKQSETVNTAFAAPSVPSDTSEVKED